VARGETTKNTKDRSARRKIFRKNSFFVIFDLSAVAIGEGGFFVLFVVQLCLSTVRDERDQSWAGR